MKKDVELIRNHRFEPQVEPVNLPKETYGECKKPKCQNVGELGNGICQECWDKGAEGNSRMSKTNVEVPIIIIS